MRTVFTRVLGRRRTIVLPLLVVLLASTTAWAFWTTRSSGTASGSVGTLAPASLTSAVGGAESAALGWSSVTAPGSGSVRYYVSRDGSTAGGNCPTSSAPSTVTSCTDANVSPGNHSYTVTAVWRSWSATSGAKSVAAISKPTVLSTSPSSRGQGATSQTITITGSHFSSGAAATFSGTGITVNSTTFQSSTELTANISVTAGASTGARNVTVTNADTGTGTGTGTFSVTAAPSIESTSPSSRGQGASAQTVTVKGKNFANGASVALSGTGVTVNSTTFKNSTELTASISIEPGASVGTRTVTVTNPDFGVGSANAFAVSAGPGVTSVSPSSRPQGAASQTITIRGSGFASGATASFGPGISAGSTTVKSSSELTVKITVEAGASTGPRTVTVTNPDSGTGSLANGFTVNAAPNVESVSPSSRGQGTSGQTLSIKGTGFASGASVSFSGFGISVESTSFVSSTEMSVKVAVSSFASTGSRTVTVTNSDGGSDSLANGFTVNAKPNVESASPGSGDRGGTENVTVKGTGFQSGAVPSFGSGIVVNSTTWKSSTELTASVTIEAAASLGSRTVIVTNPDAGSDSAEAAFAVSGAPTVTSVNPSSRGQGASSQTVAIKGSNFENGAGLAASFSGSGITVNSTSFVSSTEVSANVTITAGASTGARNVTVTNPDTTSATGSGAFTVSAAPTVESTNPGSRGQGASKQTVAIKGAGFANGASASFGSGITVESTSFVSSTELSAKISIESGASTGTRAVTVTNPDFGVGSNASAFSVSAGPTVTSTNPSSRGQGAGKQTIAIKGTGFLNGAVPSFSGSGITVESTSFVSSTELSAKISIESGASTGTRAVTVTNPDFGVGSNASAFSVSAGPNITSTAPSSGDRGGTETVVIKGTGFANGAASSFGGGITVNSTTFKSSTELSANVTIESGATLGSRTLTVTNLDGGSDTAEGAFTVNGAPTVTSTSPSSRAQGASSQTVAIKGTNFENGTGLAASFSGTGITVNSTSFVSSTEVSANVTITAGASTGARNVTVTNPDTTSATGSGVFTVNAAPSVTSTSPSSRGQGASGQTVAIKGTGFASGASASFGSGITVNSTTVKSSTELTANINIESAAGTGTRTVTVTNLDGGVGSLANGFTVNAGPKITNPSAPFNRVKIAHGSSNEFKVTGSGFVNGATVSISGGFTVNSTTFVSSGELRVKVQAEGASQKGRYDVTVTNPDGGSDTSEEAIENT